jgi:hypothetical protein
MNNPSHKFQIGQTVHHLHEPTLVGTITDCGWYGQMGSTNDYQLNPSIELQQESFLETHEMDNYFIPCYRIMWIDDAYVATSPTGITWNGQENEDVLVVVE